MKSPFGSTEGRLTGGFYSTREFSLKTKPMFNFKGRSHEIDKNGFNNTGKVSSQGKANTFYGKGRNNSESLPGIQFRQTRYS